MFDLWFKNAVVYCLDVETYADSNDDGVGDIAGLCERIDYLAGLGVTCIWLLPCFPSPNRDNGYDISNYYDVDPRLGHLGDFVEFTQKAEARGIRVILDLVVNHTSDQHPWFQAARSGPKSPYRDYYIWSETEPKDAKEGVVFSCVRRLECRCRWRKEEAPPDSHLVPISIPEPRRLLIRLPPGYRQRPPFVLAWSRCRWRRASARACHMNAAASHSARNGHWRSQSAGPAGHPNSSCATST